ncbi:hypothetical protein RhiirA4_478177 [Rhizophagus irregularis]|uniref:Uncharacterized protein n=1 Tax=Rhizophagus irregularis TaxID=588596 RepID=A0A2I1HEE5_9GLOM|nr:hypothetical protein RhiirA4_478177 [Rhizophagus irregularis]
MEYNRKRKQLSGLENQNNNKHARLQYSYIHDHQHPVSSLHHTSTPQNNTSIAIVIPDIDQQNIINTINDPTVEFINIGTINIQQAFNIKFQDILSYFKLENFSILTLTETHQPHENTYYTEHQLPSYHSDIPSNSSVRCYHDSNGNRGSGVATLISHELSKHVIKTHQFKGRVLTLDLAFKHHKHFRIINLYLPASANKDKQLIQVWATSI